MITLRCTGCPLPFSRASTPSQAARDSGCQRASEAGCVGGTKVSPSCQHTPGSLSGVLPCPFPLRRAPPHQCKGPCCSQGKSTAPGEDPTLVPPWLSLPSTWEIWTQRGLGGQRLIVRMCLGHRRLCPALLSDHRKKTFAQTQPGPLATLKAWLPTA